MNEGRANCQVRVCPDTQNVSGETVQGQHNKGKMRFFLKSRTLQDSSYMDVWCVPFKQNAARWFVKLVVRKGPTSTRKRPSPNVNAVPFNLRVFKNTPKHRMESVGPVVDFSS